VRSVERGGDPSATAWPDGFPVEGAEVLVVEDILDTGRTLAGVRLGLLSRRPRRVRIAVLLDKPARRVVPIHADYVGFEVPDVWVVGYGLDADGLYRNLPYLTCTK
jgi:hypoxanthine phosphoribosyltransferase